MEYIVVTPGGLFWLFSTIAQTLGAIVALVGMLAIFRLQVLHNRIRGIMNSTRDLIKGGIPYDIDKYQAKLIKKSDKLRTNDPPLANGYLQVANDIKSADAQRNEIIKQFKPFLYIHLAIILASLIVLPFCRSFELFVTIFLVALLAIIALGFAFYFTVRLCKLLVR